VLGERRCHRSIDGAAEDSDEIEGIMSKLRVHAFATSIDGYGAGPNQSLENPLGTGGLALHDWAFKTRIHRMHGKDGGPIDVDDDFVARGFENIGACIIGRNLFGPLRGLWPDESCKGWWGDALRPITHPSFVLTHHSRNSLTMNGGTTFHFVTYGIRPALERGFDNAEGKRMFDLVVRSRPFGSI
jgi:dihydrofolate reductase